jgi:replicative DNA helicase
VAAFSLEMADEQLWDRMFSHLARVSMNSFARGVFTPGEISALHQRLEHFVNLPLFIEQRRGCNVADIASRLRRLKATSDLKVAIVDYLQRVHPSTPRKDGARYLEVSEVSDRLKSLALELDIVVVAPVQLNKDGGTRESASCEMDCDFHLKIVDDGDGGDGNVFLQVEKQRQGPRELQIPLRLNGQFMTLEERPRDRERD